MDKQKTTEEKIVELEFRIAKLEVALSVASTTQRHVVKEKKISAKEFLMTKSLKSEIQKTLALAYYLEHVLGMESFNIDDLITAFQAAKEKRPKNTHDAVGKNVAQGLLMEAAEKKDFKKAYVLTSTGEKQVEGKIIR